MTNQRARNGSCTTLPIQLTGDARAPLAKENLQTPQSSSRHRGESMFEDSDEGADDWGETPEDYNY